MTWNHFFAFLCFCMFWVYVSEMGDQNTVWGGLSRLIKAAVFLGFTVMFVVVK